MSLIAKYFSKRDLQAITRACRQAERKTAGEIRVSIYSKVPKSARDATLMQLAVDEFHNLKMDQTRDNTGILLFILLKTRQFQILADQGINAKVNQSTWDRLASELSLAFQKEHYRQGVVETVVKIGTILAQHFPRKADDTNELSDEVAVH